MRETLYRIDFSDIRISLTLFEEAFRIQSTSSPSEILSKLKTLHHHSAFEIFFVLQNNLSLITENGEHSYQSAVIIIPPHYQHYVASDSNTDGYFMYFNIEPLSQKSSGIYERIAERLNSGVTVLPLSEEEQFYTTHLESSSSDRIAREDIRHLLTLLFAELFRRMAPSSGANHTLPEKRVNYINTIDAYVSDHYGQRILLSDLAAKLYLCPKQVARIIRREYGCSLTELVNRRRLGTACMLLKHTDLEIREICANVGFEYENYFYTLFRKSYGTTPRKYRKEIRKKEEDVQ